MPTLKVTFASNTRKYVYTAPEGPDYQVADIIIVDSPSSSFTVTRLAEIDPAVYPGNKPIVGHVPLAPWKEQLAKAARREEIQAQLDRSLAAQSEVDRYASLAQSNPGITALLEELKAL